MLVAGGTGMGTLPSFGREFSPWLSLEQCFHPFELAPGPSRGGHCICGALVLTLAVCASCCNRLTERKGHSLLAGPFFK